MTEFYHTCFSGEQQDPRLQNPLQAVSAVQMSYRSNKVFAALFETTFQNECEIETQLELLLSVLTKKGKKETLL